jgi:hypothetical protein
LLSTIRLSFIQPCLFIVLMLCFACQSIAQMPTQRPGETAGEYGARLGQYYSERNATRRKERDGYIMIAVVIGIVILVGVVVLAKNQGKKMGDDQMLNILKKHLRQKQECPWCKEPAVLTQTRCTNCQLEISWYKTIACKPGEEQVGKSVWEYYQREIRKYSRRNR